MAYKDQADWIGEVGGRVLDIGCYDGRLLKELKANGADELFGVEPDKSVDPDCERFYSIEDIPVGYTGAFDLITIMHVLEHVADPAATLRRVEELTDVLADHREVAKELDEYLRAHIDKHAPLTKGMVGAGVVEGVETRPGMSFDALPALEAD